MRSLIFLALIASPATAQVVGWADCRHTRTDEDMVLVQIALMNGKVERWSGDVTLPKTKAPGVTLQFEAKPLNYTITGMRIECSFDLPASPELEGIDHATTLRWRAIHHIKVPAGVGPKFGVNIVETSPGLWRAFIGKAP